MKPLTLAKKLKPYCYITSGVQLWLFPRLLQSRKSPGLMSRKGKTVQVRPGLALGVITLQVPYNICSSLLCCCSCAFNYLHWFIFRYNAPCKDFKKFQTPPPPNPKTYSLPIYCTEYLYWCRIASSQKCINHLQNCTVYLETVDKNMYFILFSLSEETIYRIMLTAMLMSCLSQPVQYSQLHRATHLLSNACSIWSLY